MKEHKFTQHIGLKIIALLFSFLLWLFVVNIDNPKMSKVFDDVQVTMENDEIILNNGSTYEIVNAPGSIRVTVHARRSILENIKNSDITAKADFREMDSSTGLIPIKATIAGYDENDTSVVTEVSPYNLQVQIEAVVSNDFPIQVVTEGIPRDGYVVGEMKANPTKITIGGSEQMVDDIERVVAKIDVTGLSEDTDVPATLIYYDGNGNTMNVAQLTNNLGDKGVTVNVQMLQTKKVSLKFNVSGIPASGYTYTGWSSEPESVVVCGTKEALSAVDEIEVNASEIDISGASSRVEQTVDISPYLPDGIKLVDETANKVAVTAMVEQEGGRTITLPVGAIRVTNLAENLKISVESDADLEVQLTGKEELLKKLDIQNAASINLKDYTEPGVYEIPVNIEVDSGVTMMNSLTVRVTLTEKKDEAEKAAESGH